MTPEEADRIIVEKVRCEDVWEPSCNYGQLHAVEEMLTSRQKQRYGTRIAEHMREVLGDVIFLQQKEDLGFVCWFTRSLPATVCAVLMARCFCKDTGRKISLARALADGEFTKPERTEFWAAYHGRPGGLFGKGGAA